MQNEGISFGNIFTSPHSGHHNSAFSISQIDKWQYADKLSVDVDIKKVADWRPFSYTATGTFFFFLLRLTITTSRITQMTVSTAIAGINTSNQGNFSGSTVWTPDASAS